MPPAVLRSLRAFAIVPILLPACIGLQDFGGGEPVLDARPTDDVPLDAPAAAAETGERPHDGDTATDRDADRDARDGHADAADPGTEIGTDLVDAGGVDAGDAVGPDGSFVDAGDETGADGGLADALDAAQGESPVAEDELWVLEGVASYHSISANTGEARIVRVKIPEGTAIGTAIPLPTAPKGMHAPCTLARPRGGGPAGNLARSVDGRFVTFACYGTAPAHRPTDAPRVVARVDRAGNVDTTTTVPALARSDVAGAITIDGSYFWTYGAQGIVRHRFGAADPGTLVADGTFDWLGAAGGDLHAAIHVPRDQPNIVRFEGWPTALGAPKPLFMQQHEGSYRAEAGGLVAFARDSATIDRIYGSDRMYLGVQLWTRIGSTWSRRGEFDTGTQYGITGHLAGEDAVIYSNSGTEIRRYVLKDGVRSPVSRRVLLAAGPGRAFFGLAFAPK
jgi:hypothetical protein